ncbi:MAG: SDR family oxidoreductase [Rhodobacteraceae bacterium]|nr:SDR family oxidoreductase [Paracoccaceae bacterium]
MAKDDKHLLVTGAGGKLGRLLRRYWEASPPEGWRVHWVSRQGGDFRWPLEDAPEAEAILALWGATPGASNLGLNVTLAKEAMALAERCGAGRVLHCSSSAVYGAGTGFDEDSPMRPVTEYGKAKRDMEHWIAEHPVEGVETCILRMANVIGAEMLFAAIEGTGPVRLDQFADGQGPRRSYLSVSRFAEAVLALLETDNMPGVLNVAEKGAVAMAALLEAAEKPFTWQDAPEGAVPIVALETGVLETILGETGSKTADDLVAEWRALGGRAG